MARSQLSRRVAKFALLVSLRARACRTAEPTASPLANGASPPTATPTGEKSDVFRCAVGASSDSTNSNSSSSSRAAAHDNSGECSATVSARVSPTGAEENVGRRATSEEEEDEPEADERDSRRSASSAQDNVHRHADKTRANSRSDEDGHGSIAVSFAATGEVFCLPESTKYWGYPQKEREDGDTCAARDGGHSAPTAGDKLDFVSLPSVSKESHDNRQLPEQQRRSSQKKWRAAEYPAGDDSEIVSSSSAPERYGLPVAPSTGMDHDALFQLNQDPWSLYEIVAGVDTVASWEVLQKAQLSYYTFKYDRKKGRRQLGVRPTEMAHLLPEALSTFTLPVVLPNGSRSSVEGVPNVDWTYLFAHTVTVTQELLRRSDALETKMDTLQAESHNASLKVVRLMEDQGEEWQPAAQLRELASLKEIERDIIKNKIAFQRAAGQERRRWLELRHNQTMATAEMELGAAEALAEERTSLALESLREEQEGVEALGALEEAHRRSTEVTLLLLDVQADNQTAQLSANRRLSESLATVRALTEAERGGEEADVARIRAKGEEARKQMQAVVDETFALVGAVVLSVSSDPVKLARLMAGLLGLAFVSLLVGNSSTLAARAVQRRLTKPRLVRETDLPGSLPGAVFAWIALRGRLLFGPRRGSSRNLLTSEEELEGIILPPDVEHRLRLLAASIRSSYGRGAPLPHVLIHGATGSGKSILSRRLVKMCGLHTVVVAGGDVGPLGATASAELSGLMRWAGGGGGKGVVLVIDEAEAALGDRRNKNMSENARSALNAVLLCTGELRPGFSMILTTSRPKDLDEAVLDRIDEVIHLPLPRLPERARLVRQYFSAYLQRDPPVDFLSAAVVSHEKPKTHNKVAEQRKTTETRKAELSSSSGKTTTALVVSQPELGAELGTNAKGFRPAREIKGLSLLSDSCDRDGEIGGGGDDARSISTVSATAATGHILRPKGNDFCADKGSSGWFFSTRLFSRQQRGKQEEAGVKGPRASRTRKGVTLEQASPNKAPESAVGKTSSRWLSSARLKLRGAVKGERNGNLQLSKGFDEKAAGLIAMFAVRSEGFYGRDIAHFFSAVQAAVYGSEHCVLTEQLWARTERQKLREFSEKQLMTASTTTTTSCITSNAAVNKHPCVLRPRHHSSKGAVASTACEVEAKKGNDDRWTKNVSSEMTAQTENDDTLSGSHLNGLSFADPCGGGGDFWQKCPQHLSVTASTARNSSADDEDNHYCALLGDGQINKTNEEFDRRCGTKAADDAGRNRSEGEVVCWGEQPCPPSDPEITHPDRCTEYSAAERREVHF